MLKKILQITHKPAFPSIDGGCIEMAKMSLFYQKNEEFELYIFTLFTEKHPFDISVFRKEGIPEVNITAVKADTKPNFWKGFKTIISGKSYNLSRFYSREIEYQLTQVITSNDFDIVQFESIYTGQFVDIVKTHSRAKVILNVPNIEYKLWLQYSKTALFPKKQLFSQLSKLLKKEEIDIWKKMDGMFCISQTVNSTILKRCKIPSKTIPFFVELDEKPISTKTNTSLTFFHIGAMDWKPNKEGIQWFLKNVWLKTSKLSPLQLAGKGMQLPLKINEHIKEHGFVEDSQAFIASNDVMVVPLFSGSGMRIKIIEAMALGKCVISTSKGAEGIQYKHKETILIADSEKEFIKYINLLQETPDLAKKIGNNAYELVKEKYNTKAFEKEIVSFINSINRTEK